MAASYSRLRSAWVVLCLGVIALGLASRRYDALLPVLLRKNTGDVLWATFVYLLLGLLWPRLPIGGVAAAAAAFSLAIEFGKLIHFAWLDRTRDTVLGRLVFGYAFSWGNLLCYVIGIGIGVMLESILFRSAGFRLRPTEPASSRH